ncbi:MAG TPA: response regulator [Gemmataceae bacterium]|nr:response regulator [Gemmataceae bacterium]
MAAQTLRVLVVDDDHDTVDSTKMVLEIWGYHPIGAYDGETALALAAEHQPHVVLFDLAMPGLHGYDFARRLRALPTMHDALLICVSGYKQNEERAAEAACDIHFLKPFPTDELERILAERAATLRNGRS